MRSVCGAYGEVLYTKHGDGITSLIGYRFGAVSYKLALLVYKSLHGSACVWLGGRVVRTLDLRSIGHEFESWPLRYRVQP